MTHGEIKIKKIQNSVGIINANKQVKQLRVTADKDRCLQSSVLKLTGRKSVVGKGGQAKVGGCKAP